MILDLFKLDGKVALVTRRWGEPEDLAGAAVFLASRASDYLNGHVLIVDGGWMGR